MQGLKNELRTIIPKLLSKKIKYLMKDRGRGECTKRSLNLNLMKDRCT